MRKSKKYGDIHITEEYLALPEVKEIRAKYKYLGFTVATILEMELSEHTNSIGRISCLRPISHVIGVQLKTLLNVMNNCSMFVMDYEHDIYYMPRLRKRFHLPVEPTEKELADIFRNGNIYFGYPGKSNGKSAYSNKNEETISKRSEIVTTQSTDNQDGSVHSLKSKNKELKNKDINKENDDADENKFKEILSSPSWTRSIKKRHGVNLEDESTLGIFAQWLYDYCCSNDKTLKGKSDLRQYANNLLRRGTKTRDEFDRYLEETVAGNVNTAEVSDNQVEDIHTADYEHVVNGVRYSCYNQIIPDEAPKQPFPGLAFSYISDEWIPLEKYDALTETAAYDRKRIENPGYVKNLNYFGGVL